MGDKSFLLYLNLKLTIVHALEVKIVRERCHGLLKGHEGHSGRLESKRGRQCFFIYLTLCNVLT